MCNTVVLAAGKMAIFSRIFFILYTENQQINSNMVNTNKMAILSRKYILLAILMYEQFIHNTQIDLRTNTYTVFEYSAACLSLICELLPGLIPFAPEEL